MVKTAEPKSSTSSVLQRKADAAPLFQPEGQREAFFGPKEGESTPFFAPAAPPIQAKCADCEQEEKVQKKEEKEEQPKIQPKLKIGAPDDHYEKQADAVADRVVQRLATPASAAASPAADSEEKLQRKEEEVDKSEEQVQMKPIFDSAVPPDDNTVQRKCDACDKEEPGKVQRKESGGETTASPDISSRLQSSKGGGSPLPDSTRSQMEGAMGADFSGLRVHTGSEAAGMSNDIQAQAFTHGSDVYFNEGKYSPESSDGQHLLAHELTHTIQQGAAEPATVSRKQQASNDLIQREVEPAPFKPRAPIDITNGFDPSPEWRAWIKAQKKSSQIPIEVKAGNNYAGTLYLSRSNQGTKGDAQDYTLTMSDNYGQKQFLEISNIPIFEEFRSRGIVPVIVIESWKKGQPVIKGYLSVKTSKGTALAGTKGFIESFSNNIEKLGYLGIKTPKIPTVENTFEQGRLTMKTTSPMTTVVAGYLNASMSLGIINSVMTFEVNATIDIKGIANGQLDLRRDENGQFGGKVLIQAQIQNVAAELTAEYVKTAEGADVTVQGKGRINSEKFQGEVGFIVAQEAKADALMKAQLGVQSIEAEGEKAKKPTKPAPNSRGNMALVGWGSVNAVITPWLQGMAKVGIDSKGQVTIVGEITVPGDVKLMEERGKKITLFKVEVKGGYGIPVIGQVGLFASVELFVNAGFGPLVLKNVGFTGTYSTDPTVLQNFKITGTLGINAFAILGLAAEAGVFLTLIGHDIKAGLNVTAAAGVRAYAEATPTFEYVEQAAPTGGKIGESWLRGHFEAAAQLFLQLSGEFFVSVDSPWWSPLDSQRWPYPLGQITYPIGDSLGIGGDMAWKVGSPDVPELKLSPVEFDPDKFTADVMADPPPGKGKGGDKNEKGEWVDGEGGGDKQAVPETKPGGPGLEGNKKKEDLTKLPDEQRFLRACDELGQMAKKSQTHPSTYTVMDAKAKQIKAKYAIEEVTLKGDKNADKLKVAVKHKNQDNKKKEAIEVHLMTPAERLKLIEAAAKDLDTRIAGKQDPKTHSITRADADVIAVGVQKGNWVLEGVHVVDGGDSWKFEFDLGDVKKVNPGVGKSEKDQIKGADAQEKEKTNAQMAPEEKEKKVEEGLKAIDEEEKKYLTNGAITKEEAEKVAHLVKATHPVFITLIVVDGGESWDYDFTASPGRKKKGEKKEIQNSTDEISNYLQIGKHPVKAGTGRESHHVPAAGFAIALKNYYSEIEKIVPDKTPVNKDLKSALLDRASLISTFESGKGLSAISIHKGTHQEDDNGVHAAKNMPASLSFIKEKLSSEGSKRVLFFKKDGTGLVSNLRIKQWKAFISEVYKFNETNSNLEIAAEKSEEPIIRATVKSSSSMEQHLLKLFKENSNAVDEATVKINTTAQASLNMAIENGIDILTVSLAKSTKDGEHSDHPRVLNNLRFLAKSIWNPLTKNLPL